MSRRSLSFAFGLIGILLVLSMSTVQSSEDWRAKLNVVQTDNAQDGEEREERAQLWVGSYDITITSIQVELPSILLLFVFPESTPRVNDYGSADLFISSTSEFFRTLFQRIRSINAP